MQEKAKVIEVTNDFVRVIPLDIEVCIGCKNTKCQQNGSIFTAQNPLNLKLEPGSEVRIRASSKKQIKQALIAIGVPILFAIGASILSSQFLSNINEKTQILASLVGLCAGALLVFLFRNTNNTELAEIYEVI